MNTGSRYWSGTGGMPNGWTDSNHKDNTEVNKELADSFPPFLGNNEDEERRTKLTEGRPGNAEDREKLQ